MEVGERFSFGWDGKGLGVAPDSRDGEGLPGGGEFENEGWLGGIGGSEDFGGGFFDGDVAAPGVVGGENLREEFLEITAGDGVLIGTEGRPVGGLGEDGEICGRGFRVRGLRRGWCLFLRAQQEEDDERTEQEGGDDGGGISHGSHLNQIA